MTDSSGRRVFFHGTCLDRARAIMNDTFRQWFVDEESGQRYSHGGVLGNGLYVTADWRTALWFGDTLLSVELRPGTKILDLAVPVDPAQIDSLKREFGHEVVRLPPWKVVPRNKSLTGAELEALVRYHYGPRSSLGRQSPGGRQPAFQALGQLRPLLVRHGFHGFGHPHDENGIVIFSDDRLICLELVVHVPERYHYHSLASSRFAHFSTLDELQRCFRRQA